MTSNDSGSTTGDLLGALSEDVSRLVRQELTQAQAELTQKARQAGRGAAMLGGAGVLGALAAGTSAALFLRVLEGFLPRRTAAFVATACYGAGAAGLATLGIAEVRRALPVIPEDTVRSVRKDVRTARPGEPPPA